MRVKIECSVYVRLASHIVNQIDNIIQGFLAGFLISICRVEEPSLWIFQKNIYWWYSLTKLWHDIFASMFCT